MLCKVNHTGEVLFNTWGVHVFFFIFTIAETFIISLGV